MRCEMTTELFNELQRLDRRPELPRISDPQSVWDTFLEGQREWHKNFDDMFNGFFRGADPASEQAAYRRGLWDHHHHCASPPALQWHHEHGLEKAAELVRAWITGYVFAEAESAQRKSQSVE